MQLETYVPGDLGEVIKPYLNAEGTAFARDFWMDDRVGAMQGALVEVYHEVVFMSGVTGAASARGAENIVVKPGPFDRWNESTTSPGTLGWNPAGLTYRYDYNFDHTWNHHIWIESGCPKKNAYGEWAHGGLPLSYVQWTWENPSTRGESPMPRRNHRNRHRR